MLREPSPTLDQAAMMGRNWDKTATPAIVPEATTNRSDRWIRQKNRQSRRQDFRRGGDKTRLVDTVGEQRNISPQKIALHGAKMLKVRKEEPLCKGLQITTQIS